MGWEMRPRRLLAGLLLAVSAATLAAERATWPDLSDPPTTTRDGQDDAAVIVAIQDYAYVADVQGALANGADWVRYLDSRGVPLGRVHKLFNATANPKAILRHAEEAAQEVGPDGRLWFVFIGHGAPSRDGKDGLLVAAGASADADGIYDNSVSRTDLLAALGSGRTDDVFVVLDACFSGQTGPGQPLVTGLQPLIPTTDFTTAAATVLTAAGPGQFTGPLAGQARPAFSYLVLGGLYGWADDSAYTGNGDGQVRASELVAYAQTALVSTGSSTQEPSLAGPDLAVARAGAKGPNLRELGLTGTTQIPPLDPQGEIVVDAETDYGKLRADAEKADREKKEADRKKEEAERLAEEARLAAEARAKELETYRRAELDKLRVEALSGAKADWAQVAPLLDLERSDAIEAAVEAYVEQYGEGIVIRFDGLEEVVRVPEVDLARAYLVTDDPPRGTAPTGSRYTNSVGAVLVKIPAGRFTMGSQVQVQVELTRSFWLMTTEVTQGQYRAVTGENPSYFKGDDLPVEQVSWYEAVQYANALSEREDLTPCYTVSGTTVGWPKGLGCSGYRLPTEAEWEYAARGGEGHVYSGSDTPSDVGWSNENSGSKTHAVGGKAPNAYGLYDMSGNVWEWVWDVYGSTLPGGRDPHGPEAGSKRVLRGGAWGYTARYLRVAYRNGGNPDNRNHNLGFRLARTSP